MIVEALLAFLLLFITTMVLYTLGRRSAPKTTIGENEQSVYACGEKISFHNVKINVSLYKYLIYFVVFDSSVLVIALGSFASMGINSFLIILYLGILLAAGIVLVQGDRDY
jgi:NADH:ubiquinone oxidoreductase subunit 3 (subunit A)